MVCAPPRGQLQGSWVAVDGDDLGCTQFPEHLHRDVPEPADADDGRPCARVQMLGRPLGGPVRGDARIGVRRDRLGLEALGEFDDRPLTGAQVLRKATVLRDTRKLQVDAVHVLTRPARAAQTARDDRVNDHRIARFDRRDTAADVLDPTGVLVPQDVGQLDLDLVLPDPLDDVQVRAAQTGAANAHDDVVGPLHLRSRDVLQ